MMVSHHSRKSLPHQHGMAELETETAMTEPNLGIGGEWHI